MASSDLIFQAGTVGVAETHVLITKERYAGLDEAGVDNWEWYGQALAALDHDEPDSLGG